MMNEVTFNGKSKTRKLDQSLVSQTFDNEKSRRSLEEFKKFCNFILDYEANEEAKRGIHMNGHRTPNSPNSTSGSSISSTSDSLNEEVRKPRKRNKPRNKSTQNEEYESDDESWDLVTCFCMKPFAGRPMIECSLCQIWIHLSCAKIRRSNIPELFICPKCREEKPNQMRTLVNKFEEKNSLNPVKATKTKSKKRLSLTEHNELPRSPKERKIAEL
eukprot:Seg992.1 transcript_id=Seg992.1/GoldUCD/mRNA.D3Y31 product="PHD finger protein 13" protein_id=Seg992.1/GoldUCD/D3Y31